MKRISVIEKAFERLKGYCEKQTNCERCKFHDNDTDGCVIETIPVNWGMPVKRKAADNG